MLRFFFRPLHVSLLARGSSDMWKAWLNEFVQVYLDRESDSQVETAVRESGGFNANSIRRRKSDITHSRAGLVTIFN